MDYSFGLLKPDCLKRGLVNDVLAILEAAGLRIVARRETLLTKEQIGIIYGRCVGLPYYNDLVRFFRSGICLAFLVEGDDAITKLNGLVGHFDPSKAREGTVRQMFGTSPKENVIHSAGNRDRFLIDAGLFFDVGAL